jgi:F-type H+-transporting ATPase subunit b
MNALLLLAQADAGPIEPIARAFGVDWPHLAAQTVSFAIVCAMLYRFAYHPVLAMLEERRKQIAQGLENAARIKEELACIESQRQAVLGEANAQGAKLIEEARAAAARVERSETQKAISAAEQIIARAREVAAQDHGRMLAELKREVGRLVVQTTAAVAGRVLTAEDQRRLAEETAKSVTA